MACCVIAAFILAQCVATLRRWGMYWGIVAVPPGETAATFFSQALAFLRSARGRLLVTTVVGIELVMLGGWVYVYHGEHLYRIADVAWAHLHGQEVVYVGRCSQSGVTQVRVVLDKSTRASS